MDVQQALISDGSLSEKVNMIFGHHIASQASASVSMCCFVPGLADPSVIVVKINPRGNEWPFASPKNPYSSYAAALVFPDYR